MCPVELFPHVLTELARCGRVMLPRVSRRTWSVSCTGSGVLHPGKWELVLEQRRGRGKFWPISFRAGELPVKLIVASDNARLSYRIEELRPHGEERGGCSWRNEAERDVPRGIREAIAH